MKASHRKEQTRGTETSKYPEEEKTIVIPQVVASERGTAQTLTVTAVGGLWDYNMDYKNEVERLGKVDHRG